MKQLTCEMCGSTDLIKQDGVFVCQSCGCKYSVEEAKKMMVEGTVEVKGTIKVDTSIELQNLLKRAFMFLEDANWAFANEYCEKALDIDPENAQAYLGKLMAELKVKKQDDLKDCAAPFDNRNNYQKAVRFADNNLKGELEEYSTQVNVKILEQNRISKELFKKQCEKARVRNLHTKVSAGGGHTLGLRSDGTVVAVGLNKEGQCDVSSWENIVAISAGCRYTVGLKSDGTVIAVGDNSEGQCDVSSWENIVAISAGGVHTLGLRSDGTVVAVGGNTFGQCDTTDWKDIVAISAGMFHTVGLKSDGTVIAVGDNSEDQCDVSSWENIVAISAGCQRTLGLKFDGTVVAVGLNLSGENNVFGWENIVAISAGTNHTVGLKSDGTVIAVGLNKDGNCNVFSWDNISLPILVDEKAEHKAEKQQRSDEKSI